MTRRNLYLLTAALTLLVAAPAPDAAFAAIDHDKEFRACTALAEKRPDEAFESALAWQDRGGGDLARLCQALALFHKGDFKAAGGRFEELAPVLGKDDPKAAASLFGRAGWAWLRAGDQSQAELAYTHALALQPDDVDLHIDRAFARAEAERFWDAIADLDVALSKDPKRADAYLYRAAAQKGLSNDRQALADIDHALALKPNDPEALLLRGNIKAQAGDLKGAKADWTQVVGAAPGTPQSRSAQANLDRAGQAEAAQGPKGGALPETRKPDAKKKP